MAVVLVLFLWTSDLGVRRSEWVPIVVGIVLIVFGFVLLMCCREYANRQSHKKRLMLITIFEQLENNNLRDTENGIRVGKDAAWIEFGNKALLEKWKPAVLSVVTAKPGQSAPPKTTTTTTQFQQQPVQQQPVQQQVYVQPTQPVAPLVTTTTTTTTTEVLAQPQDNRVVLVENNGVRTANTNIIESTPPRTIQTSFIVSPANQDSERSGRPAANSEAEEVPGAAEGGPGIAADRVRHPSSAALIRWPIRVRGARPSAN